MTATITYTLGRFVWHELYTKDVEASKKFYGGLFGWTTEDVPMGPDWSYTIWKRGDKQVGGMMDIANLPGGGEHVPPHWASYVSVADVDQAAERATALGGKVQGSCMDIPNVGRFAVLEDPQGAYIYLFRSATGDPADGMPENWEFVWETLMTSDVPKALDFYKQVVGWEPKEDGETPIFTRKSGEEAAYVANVSPNPPGVPSNWSTYVGVDKLEDSVAKAKALGATVLLERMEVPAYGVLAVIQDPTGAMINLFEAEMG